MTTPKTAVAGMLLLATFLPAAAVLAQDNEGPIGEIIVTAERREADIQAVPLAVSAISTEQIENQQINAAQDLQRIVPSLHMFNNITTPQNLSLSLRGGLQQDASLVTAESPVGIYVDDIFVGRLNNNNTTLSDIERVEVLRGPQGTLYGRNTAYGAVKYISRTPSADNSWADVTMGGGNYDQLVTKLSVGGGISDNWGASIAGQYTKKGDEFTNVAEDVKTGDEENISGRVKLHYDGDASDVVISYAVSHTKNDSLQMMFGVTPGVPDSCADFPDEVCGPGETAQFTTDDLVFPFGEWNTNTPWLDYQPPPLRDKPQSRTTQDILGLTWTIDINDNLQAKYIAGLVTLDDYFMTDFTAAGVILGASDSSSNQFTQELQFLGSAFDDKLDWIAGFFYLNEDADQTFGWGANFGSGPFPVSQSFITTNTESYAFFGEGSWKFTDQLKATVGGRWTEDSKNFLFKYAPGGGAITETIPLDNDSSEFTPKFSVDYSLDSMGPVDDMLLYAQAARGFKGAGFSAIAIFSTSPVAPYDPETNWTYEGGMKADWLGNRLRTNLAVFYSDIKDIQQNATDTSSPNPEFPVQNSGDAEIKGLEFEITAVPLDGLSLFLSGALMDGKYKNLNENSAAFAATELYGVQPDTPQTPDYTIDVGFDYSFDMPGDLFGDFGIGADYYKIDNYITSATNDFNNSGWDIWNAYVSQQIGDGFELRLSGKNLADDFIVTSGSRALGGFIVLPPREVLLSVTYQYGK